MKVLYINGNPQSAEFSYTRKTANYLVDLIKKQEEAVSVETVNVYETDIPLIDGDVLEAWGLLRNGSDFSSLSSVQQVKVGKMQGILKQFKEADLYIIASPLWNFSVTPMLKAYIDNISIAGETFKYTESGPVGLLGDKQAVFVQASGGVYSEGPGAAMEHGVNYLKAVFGFLGVSDIEQVLIEGVAMPDKSEEARLEAAYTEVDQIVDGLFYEEAVV